MLIVPFPLMGKEPKDQGRLHRTSPRPSKGLTLRSRSAFYEGKRQAPLREGQALSRPLRALPRPAAEARAPSPVGLSRSRARCPGGMRSKQACHTEPGRRVYLCLRLGRALFMPCLYLVYALFMPCLCLVCG